jgi:hypothetical protein
MALRKMAIVPQHYVDKILSAQREEQQLTSDTPVVQLSQLDSDLKQILDSNQPSDLKAKQYAQVLHTFSNIRSQQTRPMTTQSAPLPPKTDILSGLAKPYINRGKLLLNHLEKIPDLQWNEKDEVEYQGQRVPGTNIVDLIHAFVKPTAKAEPTWWREFATALKDSNVPQTAIGNQRLFTSEPDFADSPNPLKRKLPSVSTPLVNRLRKRARRSFNPRRSLIPGWKKP